MTCSHTVNELNTKALQQQEGHFVKREGVMLSVLHTAHGLTSDLFNCTIVSCIYKG